MRTATLCLAPPRRLARLPCAVPRRRVEHCLAAPEPPRHMRLERFHAAWAGPPGAAPRSAAAGWKALCVQPPQLAAARPAARTPARVSCARLRCWRQSMPAPPCQLRQRAHLPRLPRRAGGRGAERAPPRRADHAGHDPRRGQPRVCAPARARPALPPGAPDRRAEPRARPRHARHQLHPVVHGLQRAADRAGGRARRGRAPGAAREEGGG